MFGVGWKEPGETVELLFCKRLQPFQRLRQEHFLPDCRLQKAFGSC